MKFIRYSKFNGFDVFGVDLGGLMDALSGQLLDSGFSDDYWWTCERNEMDDSLDAFREGCRPSLFISSRVARVLLAAADALEERQS